jgi:hypothetical protein
MTDDEASSDTSLNDHAQQNNQPCCVLPLTELAAVIVAAHFDKAFIPRMPGEVMEIVQKKMTREQQVRHLGMYKEWHPNGRLRKLQHYRDGKEHGVCLKWWSNGKLWHKKECVSGELQGQRQLWYVSHLFVRT